MLKHFQLVAQACLKHMHEHNIFKYKIKWISNNNNNDIIGFKFMLSKWPALFTVNHTVYKQCYTTNWMILHLYSNEAQKVLYQIKEDLKQEDFKMHCKVKEMWVLTADDKRSNTVNISFILSRFLLDTPSAVTCYWALLCSHLNFYLTITRCLDSFYPPTLYVLVLYEYSI